VTKDLIFTFDGNPDHVKGSINVTKIIRMADIIFGFTSGNDIPYHGIEEDKDITQWELLDLNPLSDEELSNWSKLVEPLDREKKIIELVEKQMKLQEELEQTKRALENSNRQLENAQRKLEQVLVWLILFFFDYLFTLSQALMTIEELQNQKSNQGHHDK
jgi:hypothetical protein